MLDRLTPRPEQEAAIQAILRDRSHICRAEVGAGKTLVGVEAALRSGAKVTLVVSPLNTLSGWRKTFERQSGGKVTVWPINSKKIGKLHFEHLADGIPGVYFIGWERFRMYSWMEMTPDFIILDELHRASNRKSSTYKSVESTRKSQYKLGLSATPAGNKIEGMWASINWLWWGDKEIAPAFWNWVSKYLRTERDQYVGKRIVGERNPGAVWASLPSKSYFPSPFQEQPIIHEIECELTPFQRKVYDRFEQEGVVWLENNPLIADLPTVQAMRLREICLAVPSIRTIMVKHKDPDTGEEWEEPFEQVYFEDDAQSSKADAVFEVLGDLYAEKPEPVMIFTHSRKFATMLTLRLQEKGYRARQFVGGMSPDEREWKKENFGKEFDIMVSTIPTVGEGTDGLQEVCHIEFWISLTDNRMLNTQAKGRCSRPGQKHTVQRYLFLAKDTVEQRQIGRLAADQEQLDASFNTAIEEKEVAA